MDLDLELLAKEIEAERERFKAPGLAVDLVHDGRVVMSRGFGHRDVAGGEPMTEHTLMAIGSCTKAFTSAVLATLVDEDLVSWDRPVRHAGAPAGGQGLVQVTAAGAGELGPVAVKPNVVVAPAPRVPL